jgi:hypothetical protein
MADKVRKGRCRTQHTKTEDPTKTPDLIRFQLWGKEIMGKILAVRPLKAAG